MEHVWHTEPTRVTAHARFMPHSVLEGIWMWSTWSDEKQLYFNGYLLQTGPDEAMLIDPPCEAPEVLDAFASLPRPSMIILTNRDHERASQDFKRHFNIPIWAPAADAAELSQAPDHLYADGEWFPGGWQAIHLSHQKSAGETALYHAERQVLLLGDALIGKPPQSLSMLPDEKYRDKLDAVQGLQRLTRLDVETVLTCDGDPVMINAASMLADALVARPLA